MKKLTGIGLILIFMSYLYGIQAFYSFKINSAKKESEHLISNKEVSSNSTINFAFSPKEYSELDWSERNKEFTKDGHQYDIMDIKFVSGKIEVACYNDKNETRIVDAFIGFMSRMFSTPKQSSNDNSNDLMSKICKEYIPCKSIVPPSFSPVPNAIRPGCVLVNACPAIASIWHPPCS